MGSGLVLTLVWPLVLENALLATVPHILLNSIIPQTYLLGDNRELGFFLQQIQFMSQIYCANLKAYKTICSNAQ